MGLFRRLMGREPAWIERWGMYPSGPEDRLAMYSVDLGAVDAAPVAKLPVRVDVAFTYRGDGASGMPADGELVEIRSLEDALDRAMKALGGAYVGRVLTGNQGTMTGYLPPGATAPALEALPSAAALAPRLTLTPDPGWTRLVEELAPHEWQRNMIDDNRVLAELEQHGDRPAEPRDVEYLGYLPDPDTAEAAAAALRAEGFAVAYERDDEGEYVLQAVRRDPVAAPEVHAVTWLVRQTVEQHGGVYDGWGCTVQSRDFVDS
jgi:regulator of ribonuclease activity B/uncharacterized protein DUF695